MLGGGVVVGVGDYVVGVGDYTDLIHLGNDKARHPLRRQATGDIGIDPLHQIPAGGDVPDQYKRDRRGCGDLVAKHVKVSEDFTVERVASAAGAGRLLPKRS
jgi:hypothetical protein